MLVKDSLRLRLKVKKFGKARFISHQEFARALMLGARRARLPLKYRGEYTKTIKASFSPPLPLGIMSEGEYVDFELSGYISPEEAKERMNHNLPSGIEIDVAKFIQTSVRAVGKLINSASYTISIPKDMGSEASWKKAVEAFLENEVVNYERVQPRSTRVINLRRGVHLLEVKCETEAPDVCLTMMVDDGVAETIKAREVLEVLAGLAGVDTNPLEGVKICRNGLYIRRGSKFISPLEVKGAR